MAPVQSNEQNILGQKEQALFHAWRNAETKEKVAASVAWKARERSKPHLAQRPVGQRKLIAALVSAPLGPLMWSWMFPFDPGGFVFLSILFGAIFISLGFWAARQSNSSALFTLLDMGRRRTEKLAKKHEELKAEAKVARVEWENATHDILRKHGISTEGYTFLVKNTVVWLLNSNSEVILKPYVLPQDESTTVVDDNGRVHKLSERSASILNGIA